MRGPRQRIAAGIYRDAAGLAAIVAVHGHRREKRYPPDTPIRVMRKWQADTAQTLGLLPRRARGRATFAKDAERYLELVAHLQCPTAVRAEIHAWVARIGALPRDRITPDLVRGAIVAWSRAGKSPKTINNRLDRLRRIWRVLDGRHAKSPADDVDPLPVRRTPIRRIDDKLIGRVAAELEARERSGILRSPKTRARFLVAALTGRRPSEIKRTQPEDVDFDRRIWTVRDGKGGFTPGLYLTDDMLAAWRLFADSSAWGDYRTGSLARTIRSAGWPDGVRPYQLRHTVGIRLSESGADLADVAAWMGHRRLETTRKHYVPVLASRIQATAERLAGRLEWHTSVARGESARKPPKSKRS